MTRHAGDRQSASQLLGASSAPSTGSPQRHVNRARRPTTRPHSDAHQQRCWRSGITRPVSRRARRRARSGQRRCGGSTSSRSAHATMRTQAPDVGQEWSGWADEVRTRAAGWSGRRGVHEPRRGGTRWEPARQTRRGLRQEAIAANACRAHGLAVETAANSSRAGRGRDGRRSAAGLRGRGGGREEGRNDMAWLARSPCRPAYELELRERAWLVNHAGKVNPDPAGGVVMGACK